jgi:hypothetical protein
MLTRHIDILRRIGTCREGIDWASDQPDPRTAWEACPRGDWMLWLAVELGAERRDVVAAVCLCARPALRHVRTGEDRPRRAVEAAEGWLRGEVWFEDVRQAGLAAAEAYIGAIGGSPESAATLAAYVACSCATAPVLAHALATTIDRLSPVAESPALVRRAIPGRRSSRSSGRWRSRPDAPPPPAVRRPSPTSASGSTRRAAGIATSR